MINIIQREWLRLSKQPKVIVTTFLMPCVLIFLVMGVFLSGILEKAPQKIAVVTDSAEIKEFIAENKSYQDILIFGERNEKLEAMYDKGEVAVVLEIEAEAKTTRLQYDSTKISSADLLVRAQEFIGELALFMQNEGLYEEFADAQPEILEKDISSVTERERGTYDSIRLSGVEIFQFIMGKTVFTVTVGLISCALQITTVLLGIQYFMGSMEVGHYLDNTMMMVITIVLTGCISLAILVAVLIYLSTFFEKVRDAATYAAIGTLAFTLLSQTGNVTDSKVLEYLPLLNMNQLVVRNAHGSAVILPLLISLVIGTAVVAVVTQSSVLRLKSKEM